jgi:hypothetical protein
MLNINIKKSKLGEVSDSGTLIGKSTELVHDSS